MTALTSLIPPLSEELGAAPIRLLVAINSIAQPSKADPDVLLADKAAVLAKLTAQEKIAPSPETLRTRVKQINDAAGILGGRLYGGEPPFVLHSRKHAFEVKLNAANAHAEAGAKIAASALQDSAMVPDEVETPYLISGKPHHQIFISHAHESDEVEAVLKKFAADIGLKLKNLLPPYKDQFSAGIWLDHQRMGGADTYDLQAKNACQDSSLAIFMLSDRWYHSAPCQDEAKQFGFPDSGEKRAFFCVQLTGDFKAAPGELKKAPCYPMHWRPTVKNLLHYDTMSLADRDDFATWLRDQICETLAALYPQPPLEGPKSRRKASAKRGGDVGQLLEGSAIRAKHQGEISADEAEKPRFTPNEGDGEPDDALDRLVDWACGKDSPNRIFALLGSFGSGKTTTSQLMIREMLRRRADQPALFTPVPVYLDLRRAAELYERGKEAGVEVGELIRLSLHDDIRDQVTSAQLRDYLRSEPCLILFDGLDEVGTRIGPERLGTLYRSLLDIVPAEAWSKDRAAGRADWNACGARIMVTCRTHFFRDHLEQASILASNDRHAGLMPKANYRPVEIRYMAPFTPEQIQSFFKKILGEAEGEAAWAALGHVQDLAGLATKPIMARYIAELAPDLIDDAAAGTPINAATLYGHLFKRSFERDSDKRPLMTARDREKLLIELARQLWLRQKAQLGADDLDDWFDDYLANTPALQIIAGSAPEARGLLKTELRNASMLVRSGQDDVFGFVHTSFQEYFVGRALLAALGDNSLTNMAVIPPVSRETIAFLLDQTALSHGWLALATALDRLLAPGISAPVRTLAFAIGQAMTARGQAYALPLGADLSQLDLRRTSWGAQRLERVNFAGANLLDSDFALTHFDACRFDAANLANCRFDQCRFANCSGTASGTGSARMNGGAIDSASEQAVFLKLLFKHAQSGLDPAMPPPAVRAAINRTCNGVSSATFSPDGAAIVTASYDGTVRIWDVASASERACLKGHDDWVSSAMFSPDGAAIVTASGDGTARIWDVKSASERACLKGHGSAVNSAMFSPDGAAIVTASEDGTARIWDVASASERACLKGHDDAVTSAMFSPDGAAIVTASADGTARIWDVASASERAYLKGHDDWVTSAMFSPDGASIVTASYDRTARIWDVASASERVCLNGHCAWVGSAMFSPDGSAVITASADDTARIWDVASATERACLNRHGGRVTSAMFSPDGAVIVTASDDGTARIWDVASASERDAMLSLPDSWARLDRQGNVTAIGPNAWKYLHGLETMADGSTRVVNPWDYSDMA